MLVRGGENGTLLHCWWKCKLVQPLWKTVWRFLKKLKIELPYDPATLLLDIYLDKTITWKDTGSPIFIVVLFTIAKTWKKNKYPWTDEWIKKTWCVTVCVCVCVCIYIYHGILVSHKNEIMPLAAPWMKLEIIILSEVSQKKKDKYYKDIIYINGF